MENTVFVYGSLMSGFYNFDTYLKDHAVRIEKGYVHGILFDMPYKGYPALLLEGDDKVWGEIITVRDLSLIIDDIDSMEHYAKSDNDEYTRLEHNVYRADGEQIKLGVYTYLHREQDPLFATEAVYIPSGDWREYKENNAKEK